MRWVFNPFTCSLDAIDDPDVPEDVRMDFDFTTASPSVLQAVASGSLLVGARILITQAFDASASLSLGTSSDASAVLSSAQIDARTPGEYASTGLMEFAVSDFLILNLAPAGATQGRGVLLYRVRT